MGTTAEAENVPHAVLSVDGFLCKNCKGVFVPVLPIDLEIFSKQCKSFAEMHRYCKPGNKKNNSDG